MKHYFVKYPRGFYNEFSLCWINADPEREKALSAEGWERVTRKKAVSLAILARNYYKVDASCAGYADTFILPYDYNEDENSYFESWMLNDPFAPWASSDGYVVERWQMQVFPK